MSTTRDQTRSSVELINPLVTKQKALYNKESITSHKTLPELYGFGLATTTNAITRLTDSNDAERDLHGSLRAASRASGGINLLGFS